MSNLRETVYVALVPNQIAIPGMPNGVTMISPSMHHHNQQQQSLSQLQSSVAVPTSQTQPQRVEVGEAGGSSVPAVATILTRFKCNQCESVYNNRDSIIAHIYTHMKVRPFKCALCNSIAAMSKTILKHLNKEHGTSDPSLILEQRIPNENSYYSVIQ